jgi:hypothetical protein
MSVNKKVTVPVGGLVTRLHTLLSRRSYAINITSSPLPCTEGYRGGRSQNITDPSCVAKVRTERVPPLLPPSVAKAAAAQLVGQPLRIAEP